MGPWNSDESGQIIIIAALLLAVIFVGLALVLNSAIYTENMATRGDTSTAEAMSTGSVTEERLGHAVEAENHGIEDGTYPDRTTRIRENVSSWDTLIGGREARTGRMYKTELTGVTNGTRVNQSDPNRDFTPANSDLLDIDPLELGGDANWKIAEDSDARAFEMSVERGSLTEADPGLATEIDHIIDTVLTGTDRFWTEFQGDTTTRMYLLNDSTNNSVAVLVTEYDYDTDTEEKVGVCSAKAPDSSDYVTIRINEAEIEGSEGASDCEALDAIDQGRQDFYYAGSDHATGTYQFLVDREEQEFRDSLTNTYDNLIESISDLTLDDLAQDDFYADSPTDEDPYTTRAIYGVSAETTYQDDRITYTRNVTFPPAAR